MQPKSLIYLGNLIGEWNHHIHVHKCQLDGSLESLTLKEGQEIGAFTVDEITRNSLFSKKWKKCYPITPISATIFQHFIKSKPLKITSVGTAFLQHNIYDTTLTMLEYERNIKGHIFVSWIHPFKEHRLMLVGSEGMISFEDSAINKPLKYYDKKFDISGKFPEKKEGAVKLISYDKEMPLLLELKYFIEHLDGSSLEIANANNAVEVVDILVQASQSLIEGVPVE